MSNEIGTLARGLQLLRLVNHLHPVRVRELEQISGLHKATVSRLLSTLVDEGYLVKSASSGCYSPTSQVKELSDGIGHTEWIQEIAAPELNRLSKIIQWPSDFAIFQGRGMSILYSTRKTAPLNHFIAPINVYNIPMFDSDFGRAMLAWASDEQRKMLLAALSRIYQAVDFESLKNDCLLRELHEARARGYAIRSPRYRFAGANTIAVGVILEGQCIASFNVLCKVKMPEGEIARLFLTEMSVTAGRIERALRFEGARILKA